MSFFGLSRNHRTKVARSIVVSMVAGSSSAVYAQADDEIPADLEALVDAAQSPETAIAAAREQIADDDLSGAASTLERALLNDRNADEVRALYATVLCRLDDPKGAAVEVGLLDRGNISSAGLSELKANCGLTPNLDSSLRSDADGSQFWGTVSAGFAYDGDAVGAITLQFFDTTVANPLPAFSADGLALTNSININYRGDPKGGSSYFYGGASIDSKIQLAGAKLPTGPIQFQLAEIRLGLGGTTGTTEYNVGPVFRHGRIYNDPFVNEYGIQVGAAFQSGTNSQILVDAEIVQEDFTANVNGNPFTDGLKISFSLASLTRTDDKGNYIYFGAEGQYKDADFRDYSSARVFAAARLPVGSNGTYAKLNATARYVDYRTNATFFAATDRKDFRLYGRAALGIPINDDGFFLEGGVSYSMRDSNRASGVQDFDSFGADMKLVWKF